MTTRNMDRGFYVVNAAGQDVEWYYELAPAIVAARHRPDGPCTVQSARDGTTVAQPAVLTNVSGD